MDNQSESEVRFFRMAASKLSKLHADHPTTAASESVPHQTNDNGAQLNELFRAAIAGLTSFWAVR